MTFQSEASVLVAKKALRIQRQQGDAAVELLKAATELAACQQNQGSSSGSLDVVA
ncbi:MAG: hypothetical protein JNM07_10165 [Phycisphaerae bacterium]|nr:hypothetical protein [Phycisphaerae bacterium]